MKPTILVACCWVVSLTALASPPDTLQLQSGDVPGLVVMRTGRFEGSALFGYMDGGAELYKEFGFTHLTVQEVKINEQELLVEIFRMRDSLRAFGIFSISRALCPGDDSTARYWCRVPGEVQCAAGPYFMRIQVVTAGIESRGLAARIGRHLISRLPDCPVTLPWFSGGKETPGWERKAVVVFGALGIQNGVPEWNDLLEGATYSSITILPWLLDGQPATIGWIQCPSVQTADFLARNARAHRRSVWRCLRQDDRAALLVIDSEIPSVKLESFAESLLKR